DQDGHEERDPQARHPRGQTDRGHSRTSTFCRRERIIRITITRANRATITTEGLATRDPSDCTSPTRIATRAAPRRLPIPPAPTTTKAYRITSPPTVG